MEMLLKTGIIKKVQLRVLISKHWAVDALVEKWAARNTRIARSINLQEEVCEWTIYIPYWKRQRFMWDISRLIASGILVEVKE